MIDFENVRYKVDQLDEDGVYLIYKIERRNKMKAVFKGYKSSGFYKFTVGKVYDLIECESIRVKDKHFEFKDDSGCEGLLTIGDIYDFEFATEDESLICSEFLDEDDCIETTSEAKLRYYINGHEVDVIEFGNVRYTVGQLDEDGVKCDTIKFEVKFE